MSKKDFQAIAVGLAQSKPIKDTTGLTWEREVYEVKLAQWEADVFGIAGVCERSNPKFNRGVFYLVARIVEVNK